ncbi:MAG: hypothetical protein P4N59_31480 [Negativicutes bacterium]|nr:hypothetical protein [Negativicutes bacterium]
MKILERTLAIIALLALGVQTVRHAYMLWFEPRGSVLDKYDQPLSGQITNARSLDELVSRYDSVHKDVVRARLQQQDTDHKPGLIEDIQVEPYKSENMLRTAIQDWEGKAKEVYSLKFYWTIAFCCLALGSVIFKWVNRWLGLTIQIAAFSEFIYWTSPTFLGPTMGEFDRLLKLKLALSAISLVLLLVVIWIQKVFTDQKNHQALS